MMNSEKIKVVILAAGKGKRMESDLPKVLLPVKGKSLIAHLLEKIREVYYEKPIVVIGHKAELVKRELSDICCYVLQREQLGTGHAVSCAKKECTNAEHILVLYGDQPFVRAKTIQNLIEKHLETRAKITFATIKLPDFEEWRKAFFYFGRVLRKDGRVIGIREYKDTSEEEKNIKEVNAGGSIFEAKWLWENLDKVKNENTQKEYYLTDLLRIASEFGDKIETVKIEPLEALGANTKEELGILEKFAV